jgi:predicted transcriptional regulator
MEIHLTPEQEAHLLQVADHEGKGPEQLIVDLTRTLLEDDLRARAILRERIAEADRGIFIEEEEMASRFEKMMRS